MAGSLTVQPTTTQSTLTAVPTNSDGINFAGVQPTIIDPNNLQGGGAVDLNAGVAGGGGSTTGGATSPSLASSIGASYQPVLSAIDAILNRLPSDQATANGQVDTQYGVQHDAAQSNYDRSAAHLAQAKTDLHTNTAKALRDLSTSIRQTFGAYDASIGANGGGDSSATGPDGQLSYALQKVESQNRTNINNNATQQDTQIDLKQGDADAQLTQAMKQLDAWKSNQIISIAQQFQTQRDQLNMQKASATGSQAQAIATANQNLLAQTMAQLGNVDQTHQAAVNQILGGISAPTAGTSGGAFDSAQGLTVQPVQSSISGLSMQGTSPGLQTGTGTLGVKKPWE